MKTIRKKSIKKVISSILSVTFSGLYFLSPSSVFAALRNPVIDEALGGSGSKGSADAAADGSIFASYFVFLWRAFINIGGIAVLIYFLWGAFEWITAGGDSSKVGNARNKMTHAAIGLIILVSSFTIIGFISSLFFGDNFNLLELTFPSPDGTITTIKDSAKMP